MGWISSRSEPGSPNITLQLLLPVLSHCPSPSWGGALSLWVKALCERVKSLPWAGSGRISQAQALFIHTRACPVGSWSYTLGMHWAESASGLGKSARTKIWVAGMIILNPRALNGRTNCSQGFSRTQRTSSRLCKEEKILKMQWGRAGC